MNEFRVYTPDRTLMWFGRDERDVRNQAEFCGFVVVRVEYVRTHEVRDHDVTDATLATY